MNKYKTLKALGLSFLLVALSFAVNSQAFSCSETPTQLYVDGTFEDALDVFDEGHLYLGQGWKLIEKDPVAAKTCFEHARTLFSISLNSSENSDSSLMNRAAASIGLGLYREAIVDYENVVAMKPEYIPAHLGIAIAYENSGDVENAIAVLSMSIDLMYESAYWSEVVPERIRQHENHLLFLESSQN